jgi:hypothetical protein
MKKIVWLPLLFLANILTAQGFKVIGYLPTYRFDWVNDLEFERVTHVNIAFANPDAQGNLSCEGADITPIVNAAHQQGCKVFISLAGGYLTPEWEAAWNHWMLPGNRAAFIQKIVQYVQTHQLDGVDMDLEWHYVNDLYSPFMLELKAALSPLGIPMTAALPGGYRYPEINAQALEAFDWINMMVYDLTGPWAPQNPGQHSPFDWSEDCIQYWLGQGVPAHKLTLGLPFYGYDFGTNPAQSVTYRGMVEDNTANAYQDQFDEAYWNGIPTIHAKTKLAMDQVSGIMIWELGQDAFGSNAHLSLLRTIDDVVKFRPGGLRFHLDELMVRPNPAAFYLFCDWLTPLEDAGLLRFFDMTGVQRLAINLAVGEQSRNIPLHGMAPGLYFMLLQAGNVTLNNRVIVAKPGMLGGGN